MATSNRICKNCKKDISNLQPQCIRCKNCQKEYRIKYNKKSKNIYRKNRAAHRDVDLGTTDFNAHRKKDFDEEAAAIKKEMQDLGLR